MFRKVLLVVPALCLAVPAIAQTDAAQTPVTKPAKPKKTCRSEEFTGSRMPQRTCHTEAEWAAIDGGKAARDPTGQARQYGSDGRP